MRITPDTLAKIEELLKKANPTEEEARLYTTLCCETMGAILAERKRLREALTKVNKQGLDRALGQIVGSEHYEKAWLDCVEEAGKALAEGA